MGGRTGYSIDRIIGKSSSIRPLKRKFIESVKSKSSKDIVQTSLDLFKESDVLDNFVKIVNTFDFVKENADKPYLKYKDRRKLAADYWAKRKKEKEIEIPFEVSKIIVDSLALVIRRREEK